jgi:arginase
VSARVTVLRGRTSDRSADGARGAQALGEALAARLGVEAQLVGQPGTPRDGRWEEDLREGRDAIAAAGTALEAALDDGAFPILLASDCTIAMATLPVLARREPATRVVWLDAHGDFNTPDTTASGFLGGMCLAAACGRWDAGWPDTIDPATVSFLGVRDLDPGEREEVERAGLGSGVPAEGPVYVHLDCDGLDPDVMPVQFPVPGGLAAAEVRDVLAALASGGRLVGLEVTALEYPEHVDVIAGILEPVTG